MERRLAFVVAQVGVGAVLRQQHRDAVDETAEGGAVERRPTSYNLFYNSVITKIIVLS